MIISIFANLGVLGYFKYTNFFLDNVWWGAHAVRLPSRSLALRHHSAGRHLLLYVPKHDLHDRDLPAETSSLAIALEISCFSWHFFRNCWLVRSTARVDLLPQFARRIRATALDFETGLVQFALGAVKKLVISDQIAPNIDLIFKAPGNYDGFTLLQGALGYAIQIYCDFSGYSDMAIGSARMMGFRFMENFQMPYSSVTITEFWRRWHISLSTWLTRLPLHSVGRKSEGNRRECISIS